MIQVRWSRISDAPELVRLNQKWQRENLSTTAHGFLSAVVSLSECEELILQCKSVTVECRGEVIGYYLLNPAPHFRELHEKTIDERKRRGTLPVNARVAHSAQRVIEAAYQGKGLLKSMIIKFHSQSLGRYVHVAITISVENPRSLRAHQKLGWRIVGRRQGLYIVSTCVNRLPGGPASLSSRDWLASRLGF